MMVFVILQYKFLIVEFKDIDKFFFVDFEIFVCDLFVVLGWIDVEII